jgi:mitochondrial intermediate peptidase
MRFSAFVFYRAELCRNVHPDPAFVRAADEAYLQVSVMTTTFNSDQALYKPLQLLHEASTDPSGDVKLSEEQMAMLASLKLDFERGGIALSAADRDRVGELQNKAASLGAAFGANVVTASATINADRSKLRALPPHILRQLSVSPDDSSKLQLPVGDPIVSPLVLKHVRDRDIRKQMYVAQNSRCAEINVPILDRLLSTRHELAQLLGFEGYAHLMFQSRLASSPEKVSQFLRELSTLVRPSAMREDQSVLRRKRAVEVSYETSTLEAWDRSYYMGMEKSSVHELDASEVAKYLPLDACLVGMAMVMESIFGISMVAVSRASCKSELWHEDVKKLELVHESEGVIGHVFLDLYPRDGKYGHAAHFCIRSRRDPMCDSSELQRPLVALVCNFTRSAPKAPTLLSFCEYETLWHEFGHALHSLLSRTRYQHLSGTRVATDFVEVPSHLFEYFAWDPRVLAAIARHCETGKAMPTRHVFAMCNSKSQFVASDIQSQAMYACLDLEFHGAHPPIGSTTDTAARIQSELTTVPQVPGTAPQATFLHFVHYGGGYYSYVLARLIASQLWTELFANNPLSRESGDRLRLRLLALGAANDPARILRDLLATRPNCHSYFTEIGAALPAPTGNGKRRVALDLPLR